jgi:hypothetical protein
MTAVPGLPFPVALAAPTVSPPPFPGGPQRATRTLYRLYLSQVGGDDLLSLPMASLECRRRLGASTWLAVTVPAVESALLAAINARNGGEIVVYAGTETAMGEFLRATVTNIAVDDSRFNRVAILTGRVIPTPFDAASYDLTAVSMRGKLSGARIAVCAVDPRIRPNDTVFDGAESWIAGMITYRIAPNSGTMRITEAQP